MVVASACFDGAGMPAAAAGRELSPAGSRGSAARSQREGQHPQQFEQMDADLVESEERPTRREMEEDAWMLQVP